MIYLYPADFSVYSIPYSFNNCSQYALSSVALCKSSRRFSFSNLAVSPDIRSRPSWDHYNRIQIFNLLYFYKVWRWYTKKQPSETHNSKGCSSLILFLLSAYAIAAPKSFRAAFASSSGASLQITLSHASAMPAPFASSSQFLIHSPSPHP